ncbi:hypothetical protein AAMO2058_000182500 [Amorphochlora amoebiformis]
MRLCALPLLIFVSFPSLVCSRRRHSPMSRDARAETGKAEGSGKRYPPTVRWTARKRKGLRAAAIRAQKEERSQRIAAMGRLDRIAHWSKLCARTARKRMRQLERGEKRVERRGRGFTPSPSTSNSDIDIEHASSENSENLQKNLEEASSQPLCDIDRHSHKSQGPALASNFSSNKLDIGLLLAWICSYVSMLYILYD